MLKAAKSSPIQIVWFPVTGSTSPPVGRIMFPASAKQQSLAVLGSAGQAGQVKADVGIVRSAVEQSP